MKPIVSSTSCTKNKYYSKKLSVRKVGASTMYGNQRLELHCDQYKKLKNFVSLNWKTDSSPKKISTMIHPAKISNRKTRSSLSCYNLSYLHPIIALIVCTILSYWNPLQLNIGASALSSSDSQISSSSSFLPPQNTHRSRQLTEKLLNLDLGYNVLNSQMLRQGMGLSLETLDDNGEKDEEMPRAQSRMDSFNRHDYGDEDWVDDFHDEDDDHVEEYLPTPQHLGMDNRYFA